MNPIYYIELELETKEVDGVKKKVKKHCVAAWLSMQTIRKNRRRKDKIIINTRQAKISLYTPFEVSLIYDCDLSKTSIYGIAPWHRKNVSETITLRKSRIWNLKFVLGISAYIKSAYGKYLCNLLFWSIYKWTGKQGNWETFLSVLWQMLISTSSCTRGLSCFFYLVNVWLTMLKLTSHFDKPPVEGVAMGTYVTLNGYLSHLPANEQRDEFFSCISLIFWPLYQIQSLCFRCRTIRHTICLPQHNDSYTNCAGRLQG